MQLQQISHSYTWEVYQEVCVENHKKIGEWKEDSSYYSFPEGANAQLYTSLSGLEPGVQACCSQPKPVCPDHCVSSFPLWKMKRAEL